MKLFSSPLAAAIAMTFSLSAVAEASVEAKQNLIDIEQAVPSIENQVVDTEIVGQSEPKDGGDMLLLLGGAAAAGYLYTEMEEIDDEYGSGDSGDSYSVGTESKVCGANSCPGQDYQLQVQFDAAEGHYNSYIACLEQYAGTATAADCIGYHDNHRQQCDYAYQVASGFGASCN